jgi:hypothetical protein
LKIILPYPPSNAAGKMAHFIRFQDFPIQSSFRMGKSMNIQHLETIFIYFAGFSHGFAEGFPPFPALGVGLEPAT